MNYRRIQSRKLAKLGCRAVSFALAASCITAKTAAAAPIFYGPTPYLSFADSPFKSLALKQFYLETFEDGKLNVPGITITNNQPGGAPMGVVGPGIFEDSVDGDDGKIDGLGQNGHSYANIANQGNGSFGITLSFNSAPLGGLPTFAGLVWTDGSQTAPTLFEAFDANGNSLGTIGPVKIGDNSFAGTTAEDHFFGVSNPAGISRITIRDPGSINSLEIDHVQYGLDVPRPVSEPETASLLVLGMIGLRAASRMRSRRSLMRLGKTDA
jgi:hypothetical protein